MAERQIRSRTKELKVATKANGGDMRNRILSDFYWKVLCGSLGLVNIVKGVVEVSIYKYAEFLGRPVNVSDIFLDGYLSLVIGGGLITGLILVDKVK